MGVPWMTGANTRPPIGAMSRSGGADDELGRRPIGFDDDFAGQGLPTMRDAVPQLFMPWDPDAGALLGTAMRARPASERADALKEVRRRHRSNAVSHEQVAELYRQVDGRPSSP